jgi:beta-lactamase class A
MTSLQDALAPIVASAPSSSTVAVVARHLERDETAAFAPDRRFKAASTIKVAIMAALARAIDAGRLDPEARVPVRPEDVVPGSGVARFLATDHAFTLNDHCFLMIAISDNTCSNILIDQVGLQAVQDVCRTFATDGTMLGRKFFGRAAEGEEVENWATARGLATLLERIAGGDVASPAMTDWMMEKLGQQQHKDRLARSLQWETEPWFGGKTGTIAGFSHDCGIFRGPGGTIVCSTLTEHPHDIYLMEPWMGDIGAVLVDRVR